MDFSTKKAVLALKMLVIYWGMQFWISVHVKEVVPTGWAIEHVVNCGLLIKSNRRVMGQFVGLAVWSESFGTPASSVLRHFQSFPPGNSTLKTSVSEYPYWVAVVVRAASTLVYQTVGSIPDTTEFFLISCDSNQVTKWFETHYNLEVPL